MRIRIRKAVKKDYDELMKLYHDFVNNPERQYNKRGNDSFDKVLKDRNTFLEVAVAKKKTIGFIAYSKRVVIRYPKPILEVDELYVAPEHRRERVGKSLILRAINFAKRNKFEYVFVASAKERKNAHKFYKAIGFNEYGYHYRKCP